MTTDELSILGYGCTGSVVSARHPISTTTRLTTIARTGCLMKMWVNDFRMMDSPSAGADAIDLRLRLGDGDEDGVAQLGRAGRGDALAGGEAVDDHDLVAEHGACLHEAELGARLPVLGRGDDEDVVTARSLTQ